jgi:hypothetical protein
LKTAQVLQIREWAEQGFHGMEWLPPDQGRPGDMLIWRNDAKKRNHVNVIETVEGSRYIHLGGNESDGMRRATWSDGLGGNHLKGVARLPFEKATTPIVKDGLPVVELGTRILKVVDPRLVGTDVAWWQTVVGAPVTGTYDEATAAKTSEFQRKAGVTDDGKVGRDTIGAMRRTLAFLAEAKDGKRPDGVSASASTISPPREVLMALTDQEQRELVTRLRAMHIGNWVDSGTDEGDLTWLARIVGEQLAPLAARQQALEAALGKLAANQASDREALARIVREQAEAAVRAVIGSNPAPTG